MFSVVLVIVADILYAVRCGRGSAVQEHQHGCPIGQQQSWASNPII
jgi:hypothetical protein